MNMILLPRFTGSFRHQVIIYFLMFLPDLVLLALLTNTVVVYRQVELQALIEMGLFKELDEMNDHELFMEYDKMIK
jgi:hypothetical protein